MTESKPALSRTSDGLTARRASHPVNRPIPSRALSEPEASGLEAEAISPRDQLRRQSTYAPFKWNSARNVKTSNSTASALSSVKEKHEQIESRRGPQSATASDLLTPPITPDRSQITIDATLGPQKEVTYFDFSTIDYELSRAQCIGKGLWSSVYLAHPASKSPQQMKTGDSTPPSNPQAPDLRSYTLFAIKVPARPDAKDIFTQEARILMRLQACFGSHQHIVAFYGIDARNSSLVFEGVIGGSLDSLARRMKVMTELSRHLELRQLFSGLASDLVSGLRFIHAAGVVHADIKPANILLDISNEYETPILRARYIDFSASFVPGSSSAANAGGTWDYMAPEQMRIQADLNTPTFASDVWSLGITLLSIIVGGSPYTAACGGNVFMLREAIKSADPLGFARMDPVVHKRLAACQDFVDCCRLVLQKDRDRRATATDWEAWVQNRLFGS